MAMRSLGRISLAVVFVHEKISNQIGGANLDGDVVREHYRRMARTLTFGECLLTQTHTVHLPQLGGLLDLAWLFLDQS